MTVLDYANRWLYGEITEGWWIAGFGLLTIILSFALWRLGFADVAFAEPRCRF